MGYRMAKYFDSHTYNVELNSIKIHNLFSTLNSSQTWPALRVVHCMHPYLAGDVQILVDVP